MKTITNSIYAAFGLFALSCFTAPGTTQAVNPPPDGGYPGFNTAEGTNALHSLTTGIGNAAVGWNSLSSNTDGSFNTALGAGTLLFNVGDQGTGDGTQNTAIGAAALLSNNTGSLNTAVGVTALVSNTTGDFNTATGFGALAGNIGGVSNNAFGTLALAANTIGNNNTAIGVRTLQSNTDGNANVAVGETALSSNATGDGNSALGMFALASNTTGNNNTAVGQGAGQAITGNSNICIGQGVFGVPGENSAIRIGDNLTGGFCFIGNIWNVGPGVPNTPVLVSDTGRLGVNTSSRRFKHDIKPMDKASEAILALKPVVFRYNDDTKNRPCFGLIAEEVAEVDPTLVIRDEKGAPFTVRYDQINAMLLNEFLKEHRKGQQQQATIAELKSTVAQQQKRFADQERQIAALTSGLQKVSAQIETSKPARRLAATRN